MLKFLLLSLFLFPVISVGQPKELKVAVYDFPPHVFPSQGGGDPTGAIRDFVDQYLNPQHQYVVKWSLSPFARFLMEVENKKADVGFMIAKTPDREKRMLYSQASLFKTSSAVIVPFAFPVKEIKTLQDLKGMTLGHSQGSVTPQNLIDAGWKFDSLSGADVIERNMARLRKKRLDGIFIPTFSNGEYMMNHLGAKNEFRILKVPGEDLELYVVFRKDLDAETVKQMNALLAKHRSHYPELVKKYSGGTR